MNTTATLSNSYQALTDTQCRLLKTQLARCYQDVAYYRHLFDQVGLDVEKSADMSHPMSQLQRLPTLGKEQIRQNYKQFISVRYDMARCKHSYSSGSTGEPFATYFDNYSWYRKKVWLKLRARFACGMSLGDRVAILEAEPEDKVRQRNKLAWLRDPLLVVRVFSLFTDSGQLLAALRQFKPDNIYGYPSHLMKLAGDIHTDHLGVPGVKRIFTASEYLKFGTRKYIQQMFDAPVYDHYGSTEFKEIAWQCPHSADGGGYHIHNNEVICEIIDSEGNPAATGESGEIVITDLRNKAMPLLRYRMNDHGLMSWEECECGYSGPGLLPLGGRSSDYIILPSREQISPYLITTRIEHVHGLIQYQIDQRSRSGIVARTVWNSRPTSGQLREVQRAIADVVGTTMDVHVEICKSIALEANGKFKVVKRSIELE